MKQMSYFKFFKFSYFILIFHNLLRIEGEEIFKPKLSNIFVLPFLCKGITLEILKQSG